MSRPTKKPSELSRRALLQSAVFTPLLLRPANLYGLSLFAASSPDLTEAQSAFSYADVRYKPHYPTPSAFEEILRLVEPGSDDYPTEKYASEIDSLLQQWAHSLEGSPHNVSAVRDFLADTLDASPLRPVGEHPLRSGYGIDATRRQFGATATVRREQFVEELQAWLGPIAAIETAEFEIFGIRPDIRPETRPAGASPLTVHARIRYDIVAVRADQRREERVGEWQIAWLRDEAGRWRADRWEAGEEVRSTGRGAAFVDVTLQALGGTDSYRRQMLRGVDFWRTTMDSACGIDVYGNNGIAAGDYDNDGFEDLYVCQPAGLPNRLYRNRGDGSFEDVTERAGVAVFDNTACALFADLQNRGLQDLLVVCGTGPLLFVNQGGGTFLFKADAFKFAAAPQGTFTHAAIADYDGDGRLDIYFCTYMYYLGLDQYHYPAPYYDARNGPPNCLMHNRGDGTFVETTSAAGLNVENNRYSFACAWGEAGGTGLPDLCIANDFGVSQLYKNNGDGTFTVASRQSHIEDVGAGMSAAWADFDNDGRQDVYIASMWEAAGQRVSQQSQFHPSAPESIRRLYQRHAKGNALYRNEGDGTFRNLGESAGVAMGRWSWSSDAWDFDHDGYTDLYVANGYISSAHGSDLAGFFWRQVVAKSPEDGTPSVAYEHGWNAINELIRSDHSWNGRERNVMFANNRDGTFSEVSGVVGLDFPEDSRSFALADIDHDGRLEVVLKNRNAPQIKILHNVMTELGDSISFRLRGHKSNRDAIGASVTVETASNRQTKYLQAGSGFLAQHSKELFFGIGKAPTKLQATVRWPGGGVQRFESLPPNHRIDIEEGSPDFAASAFAPLKNGPRAEAPPAIEPLPQQVETWLVSPLKAPEFSLPDLAGNPQSLQRWRGSFVLLSFWATSAPASVEQLQTLNRHPASFTTARLQVVAVNLDPPADLPAARSSVAGKGLLFPVVFATEEIAGIYNILYRYLFDRRRDLAIPTSFLVDGDGMIIKVYQGTVNPSAVLTDVAEAPATVSQRTLRAVPFRGQLFQGTFQRNAFTYGAAMFQHGYLDQAAESFEQVVAMQPENPEGYYNLGTLHLRRNDLATARRYLEQTVRLRPDYPEAWNNLGMISAQQGEAEGAISDFQQALKLRPSYGIALLNLGNVYRRGQEFQKAAACLDRALELQPDDPEVSYSLGMLNAQQNQLQPAAEYLQKALELRPAFPEALNNLGIVFVRLQRLDRAEATFKTAIEVAPNNDQAYLNLARLYAMRHETAQAADLLQRLLTVQPGNPAAKQFLDRLR